MDAFDERILTVIKVAISARDDRVLDAFKVFRKEVLEELALMKQLLKVQDIKYDNLLKKLELLQEHNSQAFFIEKNVPSPSAISNTNKAVVSREVLPKKMFWPAVHTHNDDAISKQTTSSTNITSTTTLTVTNSITSASTSSNATSHFNPESLFAIEKRIEGSNEKTNLAAESVAYSTSSVIKAEVTECSYPEWASAFKISDTGNSKKDESYCSGQSVDENAKFNKSKITENIPVLSEANSYCGSEIVPVVINRKENPTTFIDIYDPKTQSAVVYETEHFGISNQPLPITLPNSNKQSSEKCVSSKLFNDSAMKKKFCCDVCSKTFASKRTLKDHMLIHNSDKMFKCLICAKMFHRKTSIREHVKLHHKGKQHKCDVCGKSFAKKTCLKRHIMIHTGEKPFQCPTCNKRFSRKGYLKIHADLHCGKKPASTDPPLELDWTEVPTAIVHNNSMPLNGENTLIVAAKSASV